MGDEEKVTRYYDQGAQNEYLRLKKSPLYEAEFELTIDLINEYIKKGSSVLDIGAGPGVYSEYLIKEKGCKVGLLDLSEASLKLFTNRIESKYKSNILFVKRASATNLDLITNDSFNFVLLMGHLYHLREEKERRLAIRECKRVLKKGGYIFTSFISPYPLLPRILERNPMLLKNNDFVDELVNQGIVKSKKLSNFVEQFRCWPGQAKKIMGEEGFNSIRLRNLEGIRNLFSKTNRSATF